MDLPENLNAYALWAVLAAGGGVSTVLLPEVATKQDLEQFATVVQLETFSDSIYEAALDDLDQTIVRLEVVPIAERSAAQRQRLIRVIQRRDKLLRALQGGPQK